MKKYALLLLLLAGALGVGAFLLLRSGGEAEGPKLAPAGTVFFVDLPDIPRTRYRWTQTALHQLGEEPEVQDFLDRPKSKLPGAAEFSAKMQSVSELKPKEAFFALASIKEDPEFIAGLKFNAKKEDLNPLLDEARAWLHGIRPAGKADLTRYGSIEIETFTYAGLVLAGAFEKHWYFISNDLDLLKTTLDRIDGKSGVAGGVLAGEPRFKASVKHLPKENDALVYGQPETVTQRLLSLVAATGGQIPPAQLEPVQRIQAVAAAMKLDGENIRDALFILAPGGKEAQMQRSSLVLTSTNTLFYGAVVVPRLPSLPAGAGAFPWLPAGFAAPPPGVDRAGFEAAFGPEYSGMLNWPSGDPQPALLFTLDVRDPGRAAKFLDALLDSPLGAAWARRKIDETPFYVMTSSGMPAITPALALTDKFLLLGPNFEAVRAAAQSLKNPVANLDKTNAFQAAEGMVSKPSASFGYIDGRAMCERVYGTLRPFAIMWANFAPKLVEYVDPNKLPNTETLMRHLGPIVYSATATADGRLIESTGPVTFTELIGGAAVGASVAALPTLKSRLQSARAFSPSNAPPTSSSRGGSNGP